MVATLREATQLLLDRFGSKKFQAIYIKPPWNFSDSPVLSRRDGQRSSRPLALSLSHLRTLPLYPLGQPSAWLFLYAPTGFLPEAIALMREWGFPYEAAVAWQPEWDHSPRPLAGDVSPEDLAEDQAQEPARDDAAPAQLTTVITEQMVTADESEADESTEDMSDDRPGNAPHAPRQDRSDKSPPQAFLLIGKRERKLGMETHASPFLDTSAMRIRRLKFQGAPRLAGVQELIEYCCPPAYLELFARSNRKGWSYWGFEAELIYPGWLEDETANNNDVMFDLPDLIAQPAGAGRILGVPKPEPAPETAPIALSEHEEGEEEKEKSDSQAPATDSDPALGISDLALPLAAVDEGEERPDFALMPGDGPGDVLESVPEDAPAQVIEPDLSLEEAYETAFEQVSTDPTDQAPRPPIGETVPYEDTVPLEQLLNQDEESADEEPEDASDEAGVKKP